jgi:predicted O-methyltransferase YrrM
MSKFYTTFPFFKLSAAIAFLVVLFLAVLKWGLGHDLLLAGIGLIILGFVILSFRIIQLIYKHQQDRIHDTNQIESTLWLYSRFTPSVTLPALRDMAGSPDFLKVLAEQYYLNQPKVIVEAGSGVSSIILSEVLMAAGSDAKHYALDHLEKYADLTREKIKNIHSEVVYAPLKSYEIGGKSWKWYDTSFLEKAGPIDMLVIDGPPENIQQLARFPALPLLINHLSEQAVIILDDTNRKDEQEIIRLWQEQYGFKAKSLYTEKGTYILKLFKNGG